MMVSIAAPFMRWFDAAVILVNIHFPLVMDSIGISTLRKEKSIQSPISIFVKCFLPVTNLLKYESEL